MRVTADFPACDPNEAADIMHEIAKQIRRGMTSGLIQRNDQRGFWDTEGFEE